jgi:hypothetical protein
MRTYFSGLQDYSLKSMVFPLGFAFIFKYVNGDLVLAIVFPSGHFVQVSITDKTIDPDFDVKDRFAGEYAIIAVPQLRKTLGPIKLVDYSLWTLGSYRIAELDEVKARITVRTKLPPLR